MRVRVSCLPMSNWSDLGIGHWPQKPIQRPVKLKNGSSVSKDRAPSGQPVPFASRDVEPVGKGSSNLAAWRFFEACFRGESNRFFFTFPVPGEQIQD